MDGNQHLECLPLPNSREVCEQSYGSLKVSHLGKINISPIQSSRQIQNPIKKRENQESKEQNNILAEETCEELGFKEENIEQDKTSQAFAGKYIATLCLCFDVSDLKKDLRFTEDC